jgi:hypothetical protein
MSEVDNEIKELNKQLYPTGRAWAYVHGSEQEGTEVTRFVDGLNNPFVDGFGNAFIQTSGEEASPSKRLVNAFLKSIERYYADLLSLLDQTIADNENFDETDASNWERVYGLLPGTLTLDERKTQILNRQSYPNGIIERSTAEFIQSELQRNGFDVYVQENRFEDGAGGWVVEDPDAAATNPVQMGLGEMGVDEMGGDIAGLDYTICANYIDEALDATYFDTVFSQNEMGVGEMGVSEMSTFSAMTRDEELRFTFFIGGESYPSEASVPISRKNEFRHLILKLKQAHNIAFLYINYI